MRDFGSLPFIIKGDGFQNLDKLFLFSKYGHVACRSLTKLMLTIDNNNITRKQPVSSINSAMIAHNN